MRSQLLLLTLLVAACDGPGGNALVDAPAEAGPSDACRLENVIDRHLTGVTVASCGSLGIPDADEELGWRAAHDCVVAKNTAHEPFRVVFEIQGVDSRVATAFVGLDVGGTWTTYVYSYDGDPSGGGGETRPITNRSSCTALVDRGMCTVDPNASGPTLFRSLCLECSGGTHVDTCQTAL